MKLGRILFLSLLAVCTLGACQNTSKNEDATKQGEETASPKHDKADVPFTVAKNYFLKNTVETLDHPKFTTSEEFEENFGMATTMGESGKPTPIDFSKQYVIAVALPETNVETKLEPIDLIQDEQGDLTFTYKKEEGEELSHTISPSLIVLVDNEYQGEVKVQERQP